MQDKNSPTDASNPLPVDDNAAPKPVPVTNRTLKLRKAFVKALRRKKATLMTLEESQRLSALAVAVVTERRLRNNERRR